MNITIVGAGNIGTQFAVHCAVKKHNVIIYTSKPNSINSHLSIVNKSGNITHEGDIIGATDNENIAFNNADLIFITMPAFLHKNLADKIYPYVTKKIKIAIIPAIGGGECAFKKCLEKGATIVGLQRVPSVARLVKYGHSVCATGYRENLHVASLPKSKLQECANILTSIFDTPCVKVPCYLSLTLTPSNPILHTTRLKTIFSDYKNGVTYDSVPLFYEEWTEDSSKLLLSCDEEIQSICKALPMFDLKNVVSLKTHYKSSNANELTKKIISISSLKGLKSPTIQVNNKYIPNLNSRYFTSDFSYGLTILVQIATFCKVDVPNMKETLNWYNRIKVSKIKDFDFNNYRIKNIEDIIKFYSK